MFLDAELEELVESPMARVTKKGGQVTEEGTFQPLTLYKAAHNRVVLGVKISRVGHQYRRLLIFISLIFDREKPLLALKFELQDWRLHQ